MDEKRYIKNLVQNFKMKKELEVLKGWAEEQKKIAEDSVAPEGGDLEADVTPEMEKFVVHSISMVIPVMPCEECGAPKELPHHCATKPGNRVEMLVQAYKFIPLCPECSMPMELPHHCDGISKHFASQEVSILTEINQLAANGVFVNPGDLEFLRELRIG